MNINAQLVISLRRKRSWSQEELATACGLNLRTIQRIESHGTASLQSRKALAAAFDMEVSDLEATVVKEAATMRTFEYKTVTYKASFLTGKPPGDIAANLTKEGEKGWRVREMVMPTAMGGMGSFVWALLERETTK